MNPIILAQAATDPNGPVQIIIKTAKCIAGGVPWIGFDNIDLAASFLAVLENLMPSQSVIDLAMKLGGSETAKFMQQAIAACVGTAS